MLSSLPLAILLLLSGCSNDSSQTKDTQASANPTEQPPPETAVKDLLLWLDNHPEQADERACFELDGVDAIAVDTLCLGQHMAVLQSTGLFSQEYLSNLREEFATMGLEIKTDGFAATRDYDRYFNSQDPPALAEVLEQLKKSEINMGEKDAATVRLRFSTDYVLVYHLVMENGT